MNQHLAFVYLKQKELVETQIKIIEHYRSLDKTIRPIYFSKKYWKNAHRIRELETLDHDMLFEPAKGGLFVCSNSVQYLTDVMNRGFQVNGKALNNKVIEKQFILSYMERAHTFVNSLQKDGFHELHIDRDRAKILAQTKCNYKVSDFKSPYRTMILVYPDDLAQDFKDEHTESLPALTFCHHDYEEELLQINHYYIDGFKSSKFIHTDNYFSFGSGLNNYNFTIEECLKSLMHLHDKDGLNNHAYYYTRIAVNALMIATNKDWSTPLGQQYENEGRKTRLKVRAALPRNGANLQFTSSKISMNIPTLTMPSPQNNGVSAKLGSRQRWHTRECHWRRVRVGSDKRHEWRWIDSYEVSKDLKPLDAIIATQHQFTHEL